MEKRLAKAWDDTLFEQHYLPAVALEEHLIAQHDAFAVWLDHLYDQYCLDKEYNGLCKRFGWLRPVAVLLAFQKEL